MMLANMVDPRQRPPLDISPELQQAAVDVINAYHSLLKKTQGIPSRLSKRALEKLAYDVRLAEFKRLALQCNPHLNPAMGSDAEDAAYCMEIAIESARALNDMLIIVARQMKKTAPIAFDENHLDDSLKMALI